VLSFRFRAIRPQHSAFPFQRSPYPDVNRFKLHFGVVASAVRRIYAPGCTVLTYGDRTTYGRFVSWDAVCDDGLCGQQVEILLGEAHNPSDCLPIFEAQTKLVSFVLLCLLMVWLTTFFRQLTLLMKTVEKLLWDIDLSLLPPLPPDHRPLPPPTITPATSDFGWESTARQHNLRAYLHPPEFSDKQLSVLIETQYDLAVDHLVDLHVDPAYLSEQIQLYAAHRIESCSSGPRPSQSLINNRAVTFLLTDAIINFNVSLDVAP
jgi:hypothetical protein